MTLLHQSSPRPQNSLQVAAGSHRLPMYWIARAATAEEVRHVQTLHSKLLMGVGLSCCLARHRKDVGARPGARRLAKQEFHCSGGFTAIGDPSYRSPRRYHKSRKPPAIKYSRLTRLGIFLQLPRHGRRCRPHHSLLEITPLRWGDQKPYAALPTWAVTNFLGGT